MRAIIGLVLGTAVALGGLARGRAQQEPTPVFRAGADVVQLDVSVLDRDHHPVRGLKAADFTVLENGVPREVVAFEPIEIPHRPAPPVSWMREISPDVATNPPFAGHLVVVLIGGTFGRDFWTASTAGRIADAILEQVGPDDLTAVVYAGDNDHAQGFTSDRSRLRAALVDIKRVAPDRYNTKDLCSRYTIERGDPVPPAILYELVRVVDALRADPQRRKTVFLVAPGFRMQPPSELLNSCLGGLAKDLVRDAQRSNINIYPIDPGRLLTGWGMGPNSRRAPPAPMTARLDGIDGFRVLAESTGGRAVINDKYDRPEAGVPGIFEENASYYILGFRPGAPSTDNRFRRLDVRVSPPGLEVRTRSGYFLNSSARPRKGTAAAALSPIEQSLQGLLPSTSVQLRVAAAPFAISTKPRAAVAVAIGMSLEGAAARDRVEVLATAFDLEGESKSSARQTLEVSRGGDVEARLQLPLAPGRYELRVGVQPGDGLPGSVYTSVEVPDFSGERISLSGLVLARDGAAASDDLLPVVPTAARDFSRSDRVTAFVRVYQGGRPRLAAVTSRIVNDRDEVMLDERTVLNADRFDAQRAAQHQLDLPLARLPPGEYLLTIEASLDKDHVRRDARFTVK